MLRDITIGQFFPAKSVIHRLDPRVKLFGTVLFIVSLFIGTNPLVYGLAVAFILICIKLSKVPFKYIVRGLKSIIFILLLSLVFNLFLTDGRPLITIWKLTITYEGLTQASYMGVRLILLIVGSSLMTLTTTPNDLTDALEHSMGFLKVIKIPVHEISMMMSIALRFIPILIEETDKIMKAQQARGANFETGNVIKRSKAMIPLLVPLFVSAIRRAYDLATAMEARCYQGGEGRTKMKPLKYKRSDRISYVLMGFYLGIIIIAKIVWEVYL